MRALIIGASGQVGSALARCLRARGHTVVGTHARTPQPWTRPLDVGDLPAVERLVAEVEPDWVFCPAGFTHVDGCEERPEEARRINCEGPAAAARVAAGRGAGTVFYSTEYVFDGTAGPYAEDDPVNPLSVYGRSKLDGERAVQVANPRTVVVRTTVVYGPEPQGKNFVYQLLRRARSGEPMLVPRDQVSSPTYNADLAAASVELAERDLPGVHHVAGPTVLDRHAFALLACRVFDLDPAFLRPVTTAELHQKAARPLRAGLRIDRVRSLLTTTTLRPPEDGLRAMKGVLDQSQDPPG